MRFIARMVSVLVLFASELSAAEIKETPELARCLDNVDVSFVKNTRWATCYADELTRQDKTLNDVYRRLRDQLDQGQKDSLVKGQRAWLSYREAWCRFEEQAPMAPGGETNYQSCLLDITLQQINKLDAMRE